MLSARIDKAGWSWGCVSAIDSNGRTIWIADAHRGDGKRFVVRADEKLTAFIELEAAIRTAETCENPALRGVRVSGNNESQEGSEPSIDTLNVCGGKDDWRHASRFPCADSPRSISD